VLVGPGDDCAVVRGGPLALTVDLSVEGVHFRRAWLAPRDIGYRSAMAALSDLAAAAATPIGVLAAIAVPAEGAAAFAADIAAGVADAAAACGAVVLGGDLTRSPGPIIVDIVAVGEALAPVSRSGVAPGDELWVTGELGGAAAAVARWLADAVPSMDAIERFARPVARTAEAIWLAERGLMRAAIDLSDGLAGDAGHLAAASGCAIVLEAALLPIHGAASAAGDDAAARALALGGGDDYELCFAAPQDAVAPHRAAFERAFGVRLTRVGSAEQGAGVHLRGADGGRQPLATRAFNHFARTDP
jgi:thiamine-monophosphate kinase